MSMQLRDLALKSIFYNSTKGKKISCKLFSYKPQAVKRKQV